MKRECKNREKCTGVFEPNSVKQINFVNKMYDVSLRIQSKCRRLQHFFSFFKELIIFLKKAYLSNIPNTTQSSHAHTNML